MWFTDLNQCFDRNCNQGFCSRRGGALFYPCQCRPGYRGQFCNIPETPVNTPPQPPATTTTTSRPPVQTPPPATSPTPPATPPPTQPAPPPNCFQAQNPCNGGICVNNFFGGFRCTDCPEGFSGQFCHIQTGDDSINSLEFFLTCWNLLSWQACCNARIYYVFNRLRTSLRLQILAHQILV